MKVIHAARELQPDSRGVCVAIGMFDGLHLGHQQVIRRTIADARAAECASVVLTFDRHPNSIVAPRRVPPLIYSLPQKLRAIASLGVEITLLIHFDEAFSRQTGEQFIRSLVRDFGRVANVCVGNAFVFGRGRSGDLALLQRLGRELNFGVQGLPAVSLDQQVISSTRIRETIRRGDLASACQMLGRPYGLAGPVIPGDRLGRQLGFPTANLDTTGLVLPPHGVYAVQAKLEHDVFQGVLNIGCRPTLGHPLPQLRVEAHLLDFEGDLYGKELEVTPVKKLRDEKKFPSLEALREQIALDSAEARRVFESLDMTTADEARARSLGEQAKQG